MILPGFHGPIDLCKQWIPGPFSRVGRGLETMLDNFPADSQMRNPSLYSLCMHVQIIILHVIHVWIIVKMEGQEM